MEHTNVLLYSKFSQASRKFIETIESSKILEKEFTLLCIDNKKTRERLEKNKKLNVKEVPCILRIYQDTGYVELFEGDKAFQLLNRYIKEIKRQENIQLPSQPVQLLQKNTTTNTPTNTPIQTIQNPPQIPQLQQLDISDISDIEISSNVSNVSNVSQLIPESLPKQDSIQKQQKLINATSIDELGSDINRGQTMNTYMHVPKSVEFDIDIENRQRTIKTDRSVKSNDSGGNIVTRAMQMQKEREQESSMALGPRSMPLS